MIFNAEGNHMEKTKKSGKKKLIALIAVAVVAVLIIAVALITILPNTSGMKKFQENLNGKWDVVISNTGSYKNTEKEDVDCVLGTTVEFDTSGGLKNGGTVVKYSINGKECTEKITVNASIKSGVVLSADIDYVNNNVNTSPVMTCLTENVYYISALGAADGKIVHGTVIKKSNAPFDANLLKGSFETEREAGGSGNNSGSMMCLESAVIENDLITLKLNNGAFTPSSLVEKEEKSVLTAGNGGAAFAYNVQEYSHVNTVTGLVLETNEKYIVICTFIGAGERYGMAYRLARV